MFWELCLFLIVLKIFLIYTNGTCNSKVCLVGKTALITGGNAGLGLETARYLASRGCTVIIADKNDAKNTALSLQKETHNPNISSLMVDFSSFESVRNLAKIINSTVGRLDILINNAGIGGAVGSNRTDDGLPTMMQVNYFSHFLLVHLLADLLKKSAPSRILSASSVAAYLHATITTENIKEELTLNNYGYGNTKLVLAAASRLFAEKLKGTGVTSNCYHPGVVKTSIFQQYYVVSPAFLTSMTSIALIVWCQIFGKSVDEGCQTILHLAMADEVKNTTGKFFWETCEFPQPKLVNNDMFCENVWKLSEEIVGLRPEEKLII